MGELLKKALENRTAHNKRMSDRLDDLNDEAEDFEAEAEEFLEALTTFEDSEKERETKEIMFRKKIKLDVYVDLTGEQTELIGRLNSVHRESKKRGKNNVPDLEKAIDSACKLAASLVVPEEGRPWHKENTWKQMLKALTFEALMEAVSELLEPYQAKVTKLGKFR